MILAGSCKTCDGSAGSVHCLADPAATDPRLHAGGRRCGHRRPCELAVCALHERAVAAGLALQERNVAVTGQPCLSGAAPQRRLG
jgi:hypothetical protein